MHVNRRRGKTGTYHELSDHAVEGRSLVAKALLASAEGTEVLGGAGHNIGTEGHLNAAERLAVGSHVEENNGVGHFCVRGGVCVCMLKT